MTRPENAKLDIAPQADGHRRVPTDAIGSHDVDQNALRVLSRLQRSGYEAYLVGGCVRDLLLGRRPKDFDLATGAHPRQIKRLFRNGRIIGRRFRLVHVVYGQDIVETATFRSEPEADPSGEGDLLIREDNEFGTAAEDARRRDFTINGLFYDPTERVIHDYVEGLADLEAGVLRTIGDPEVRFAEDPVRILRAIKFATRLGFRIEDRTWEAMCSLANDLARSAPPRVIEEVFRLMRSGTALGAFRMMRACGALATLFPEIDAYLGRRDDPDPAVHDRADLYWRLVEALDAEVHGGTEPSNPLLLAVLFQRLLEQRAEELEREADALPADWARLAAEAIDPIAARARLPRRAAERAKQIVAQQKRFLKPSTKGFRPLFFMRGPSFPDALLLFKLRSQAWGQGWDIYEAWVERHRRMEDMPEEDYERMRAEARTNKRRGRRPRRRRRRDRLAGDGEPG